MPTHAHDSHKNKTEAQKDKRESHKHGLAHAMHKLKKRGGKFLGDIHLRPFRSKGSHASHDEERYEQERQAFNKRLTSLAAEDRPHKTLLDFEKDRVLGTGSFGRVLLVHEPAEDSWSACKIISKKRIIETKQVEHTLNEKNILYCMESPFVVDLTEFFQDKMNIYFILEFVNGGEMFTVIQKQRRRRFTPEQTQFFAAQMVLAFEYLHNLDVLHRDLKPENVLIDYKGCAKLTDFGFAKRVDDMTYTMCGTPEYLAPEIIANKGYNRAVDWWAVGVLIYEMRCGRSPFESKDQLTMFKRITCRDLHFPKDYSEHERALISGFLQVDITKRLGYMHGGVNLIKKHAYFKGVHFDRLMKGKVMSPFDPKVRGISDSSNFERFPREDRKPDEWVTGKDEYDDIFAGF